jgi:thymidylate synthase (FAD)
MDDLVYDPLSDGVSSLELLDIMGNSLSVVNAARVSFGKKSSLMSEKDEKLIGYLMRNQHGTPFEHITFQFRVRAPLFVVHQWERHRMASYNEESGRYIELRQDFYTPANNRTNLGEDIADSLELMRDHWRHSWALYRLYLMRGMAKEVARMVLPTSLYKEFWWTVNARSLMNFIELRADDHAQWEIRRYAEDLENIFSRTCPALQKAFFLNGRKAP